MNKEEKTIINIVCAWCGKELGEKDGEGVDGVSHSICDDCLLHHFPHTYEKVKGTPPGKSKEE